MPTKYLSSKEVAARVGVHHYTVNEWLRQGYLKGWKVGPSGNWRISEDELEAFIRRGMRRGEDAGY